MMPKLLYDRLDELGLDFVIVRRPPGCAFRASRTMPPAER
jgi:hypothetical protein